MTAAFAIKLYNAFLASFYKRKDLSFFIALRKGVFNKFNCLGNIHPLAIDVTVDIEDIIDLGYGKPSTLQTYRVNANISDRDTAGLNKRRHVFAYACMPRDICMRADMNELDSGSETT